MRLIDTHSHLYCKEFDQDRREVVEKARAAGVVRIYLPNINAASVEPMLDMCRCYAGYCFPMIGLHPTELSPCYRDELQEMLQLLRHPHPFKAIGEVGLDFYWDDSHRDEQIEVFERQILCAREYDLPLVIHSRNAFHELYDLMNKYRDWNLRGIFHCFAGNEEEARALLSFRGFMLGIGGVATYKKSGLPATLKEAVPLERLVTETDAPYLPPVPYRGKRNESAYIVQTVQELASVYALSAEEVADITANNALKIFEKNDQE